MDEALHTAVRTNNTADAIARLDAGADVNGANPASGETPLMITAKMEGRVKIAKMLLARGANVNAQNLDGDSVLHIASKRNKLRMLQLFGTVPGVNANLVDSNGDTPLTNAIENLKLKSIEVLLTIPGIDINFPDASTDSPLLLAAFASLQVTVQALLDKGADINYRNEKGDTALTLAVSERYMAVIQVLLAAGADVNIKNNNGDTALTIASHTARIDIVQALLAVPDIYVNTINNYGDTPLIIAVHYGIMENVQALIAAGADVNTVSISGQTPLTVAIYRGWSLIAEALLDVPGINVNHATVHGNTPLILASKYNHVGIVQKLLATGADVTIADANNDTALTQASSHGDFYGYLEIVQALLAVPGINVNHQNNKGYSSLLLASQKNSLDIVQLLLVKGADINATQLNGYNALYIAAKKNRLNIVEFLLDVPELDKDKLIGGKTVLQWAQEDEFVPEIKTIIIQKLLPPPPVILWKGWTRGDAEKFDTIFGEQAIANQYSCCPVCLKFVQRASGCMYMLDHNCSNLPGYYNRELYDKYRSPEGIIYWCTICGRIALGHKHYALGLADGPKPTLLPGSNPFENDCRVSNNGGGLPEKLARFRRLREYALECQDYIDQRPAVEVLDELVEEMWNTPTRREKKKIAGILASKEWNVPSAAFPLPVVNNAAAAAPAPVADVTRPAANAANPDLQPIRHEPGPDAVELGDEKPLVIQFRHRMADGTINNHVDEYIGVESLVNFLRASLPWTGHNPEYGLCWNNAGGCTARLYPEEVQPFIPADLYEAYKDGFNRQFQAIAGGSRKRRMIFKQQTRKVGHRKQRGGNGEGFGNIFVEAEDAKCYLPSKKGMPLSKNASTRNNRKKSRKTRKLVSRR